jgi:preprotein translocase SecE subunit
MAKSESKEQKQHRKKTPETVRELAQKESTKRLIPKGRFSKKIYRPLSVIGRVAHKEYNPISVPKNKTGRILGKKVHIIPGFIKDSARELKQVTWPSWSMALKLTFAVIVFAVVFAIFVQLFGYLFEKLFKYIFVS